MHLEGIRCSSPSKTSYAKHIYLLFSLAKMKDDPGSELHRALLHRTTCTHTKHPAIPQHIMKQLQTSPVLTASVQWWNTFISHYHYAVRTAKNTSLASWARLILTTVTILLDENRIRIEATEAHLLGSPASP